MSAPLSTISVVSHRQAALVAQLLDDIAVHCRSPVEVIVTTNVPEDDAYLQRERPFRVVTIRNETRVGFGANHNNAFRRARGAFFIVANPDIRLHSDPLPALLAVARDPSVAVCGPRVIAPTGELQDSARHFPTMRSLLFRRFASVTRPEYRPSERPIPVDWIAGMFMAFSRQSYVSLGGFDSRFEMYFEDVDICYRARVGGRATMLVPAAEVIHAAQRLSRRNARHFYWHVCSASRYFARRASHLFNQRHGSPAL